MNHEKLMGFVPPEHALLAVRVGDGLVGVVGLEDLNGDAPLFDVCLADGMRGMGWGKKTVRELVRHLFDTYPRITRFEAQTHDDNITMNRSCSTTVSSRRRIIGGRGR